MADKISTFDELKLLAAFADEDDRTITISNPKSNITEQQIRTLEPMAANVLIGDKYGATFTRFKAASIRQVTKSELDLDE